ncbi:hypothetical protein AAFN85_19245 [Mucilaginibacter sp. CAU 1740]|uniref:hypothetical protein n=1 Tax=Mucilaginibacter sp. CAU 1740 TaxID=3140365 RepID=UPI00325A70DA
MKKLKFFIVSATAFASLNIAFKPFNPDKHAFGRFTFFDKKATVYLDPVDYKLLRDSEISPWISITNIKKLDSIKLLTNPAIEFYMDQIKYKAGGIDQYSSAVPQGIDYFFPLTHEKNNILLSKDNSIALISNRK